VSADAVQRQGGVLSQSWAAERRTTPLARFIRTAGDSGGALRKEYSSCINIQVVLSTWCAPMLLDPTRLIDQAIADLTQLSALLDAEVQQDGPLHSPQLRTCEELLATISGLIPRLQVARNVPIAAMHANVCPNCED